MMRRVRLRWPSGTAVLLLVTWGLAACGGTGEPTNLQASQTTDEPEKVLSVGGPPKGKPIRGFCGRATVKAGSKSDLLEVVAVCAPTHERHIVSFAFSRYPSSRATAPPSLPGKIEGVYVEGPGEPTFKRCKAVHPGRGIYCGARARGPIRLRAVDVVPAGTRCQFRVDVITSFETGCPDNSCVGSMLRYGLYSGRPKGC